MNVIGGPADGQAFDCRLSRVAFPVRVDGFRYEQVEYEQRKIKFPAIRGLNGKVAAWNVMKVFVPSGSDDDEMLEKARKAFSWMNTAAPPPEQMAIV